MLNDSQKQNSVERLVKMVEQSGRSRRIQNLNATFNQVLALTPEGGAYLS